MGGGAWPFLVGGVICLVNSVNERDLSLLNNVVNDSSLAAFLRGTWNYQIPGRVRQQQVCDALRCSGLHACYNDTFIELFLGREAWAILETCVVLGIDYCNY